MAWSTDTQCPFQSDSVTVILRTFHMGMLARVRVGNGNTVSIVVNNGL